MGEIVVREERSLSPTRPGEMMAEAKEMATALKSMIESSNLLVEIGGNRYVKCEGWTSCARLMGFAVSEDATRTERREDGSFVAVAQLRRLVDGLVVAEASAECGGETEPMWHGRSEFARRSMAITRATAKVCRMNFSWILVMGTGFQATPAEEMDGVKNGHDEPAMPNCPKCGNVDPVMKSKYPKPGAIFYCNPKSRGDVKGCGNQFDPNAATEEDLPF